MLAAPPTPERSSREIVTELLSEPSPERAAELLRKLLRLTNASETETKTKPDLLAR